MSELTLTRRKFLRTVGLGTAAAAIASCAPGLFPSTPATTPTTDNPFARPTFTAIPSTTPPVDIIKNISDRELERFASTTLSRIFETAYSTNSQVQAARKANSSTITWDNPSIDRAHQSFTDQFKTLLNVPSGQLAQAIKTRVEQLKQDYQKGIWFYPNWGSPDIERRESMFYFRAIEEIYEAKGYAVEYDPDVNKEPHKMTIYKKGQFSREEKETTILGISLGRVARYTVNSDPKNGAVLFDSYPLLGQTHPDGQAYTADVPMKYYIHTNEVQSLNTKLEEVRDKGRTNNPLENPNDNDSHAKAIRDTAKRILAGISSKDGNINSINNAIIDLHERTHLLRMDLIQTQNERRSYTFQLAGNTSGGPRLSLATLLFVVSQSQYLDKVRTNSYYSQTGVPAMYPGVPETIESLIEAITLLPDDSNIKSKFALNGFSGSVRGGNNSFIPNSSYSTEYALFMLSQFDKLDDVNINELAKIILHDSRNRYWYSPGTKPIIPGLLTREEFNNLAITHPGPFLAAIFTGKLDI